MQSKRKATRCQLLLLTRLASRKRDTPYRAGWPKRSEDDRVGHDKFSSFVEDFDQALPVRRRYGQLAGFSQLTIHGVPNLSTNMPNRRAQKVSPIGI